MATGAGKTTVAFQICWKFRSAGLAHQPRLGPSSGRWMGVERSGVRPPEDDLCARVNKGESP
ncbi:MAG: hypothetical protein M3176_01710 [Chloroflexota bacterium]|nr:hypothetical protein [Chloroflexota bacterium]